MKKSMVILLALAIIVAMAMPAMADIVGELETGIEYEKDGTTDYVTEVEIEYLAVPVGFEALLGIEHVLYDMDLNFLEIAPQLNYAMNLTPELEVGVDNTLSIYAMDLEDDMELTIEPFANYAMNLTPELEVGVDNTLTLKVLDAETQELEIEGFANYAMNLTPELEVGADNTLSIYLMDHEKDGDMDLEIEPFVNYAMNLTPELEVGVDNTLTIGLLDADGQELAIGPFAEYTFVDNMSFVGESELTIDLDNDNNKILEIGAKLEYSF